MEYTSFIKNMIDEFVSNLSKPALFIKHYNKEELTKSEFLSLMPSHTSVTCLYHEYQPGFMYEAYEPFLNWIRFSYINFYQDKMSPEDFLRRCKVYSLHLEPLSSYISSGECTRTEDIMYTELTFEKSNFLSDIVNILKYISLEHSMLFTLYAFHLAPLSTIEVLLSILRQQIPRMHFIVVYNDTYYPKAYLSRSWNDLINFVKDYSILYELGHFSSETVMVSLDDFIFETVNTKRNITYLTNMYHTFALQDMGYYMSDIYSKVEHNLSLLSEEDTFKILQLYVLLCLANSDNDGAVMACKLISKLDGFQNNPMMTYNYHYLSMYTQMTAGHMDIINASYQHCVAIAADLNDNFLLFKANLLYCMAQFCGWKDLFLCDFRIPVQPELLDETENYGFLNHLAYLYTMGFENDEESITKIATGEENSVYFTKGIQLGKELENSAFLMSAYMKNIILYSDCGYHEYVYHMHKKRIETVNSDDKILQAHMYLGIGYNCIILENYSKADQFFRDALHNLADEGRADDCMDALYNICMNYFVIEDYETVIPCVETLLKMLSALGFQNIMVCNTAKLYAMLAISYFHTNDFYNTHHYLGKMEIYMNQFLGYEDNTEYKYWEEELFLYHYIRAILCEKEGNLSACQKELDIAYRFLWLLPGTIFYTYSLYTVTQANVYTQQNKLEERHTLFDTAISYYKKQGFMQCATKLTAIAFHDIPQKVILPFNEPDLWFDKLLTLANYCGTQNKLKYREKDISFLTIWQENINTSKGNVNDMIENAVSIMQNSYSLCDVVIIKKEDNKFSVIYNNGEIELSATKMRSIFAFFQTYKRGILSSRTDKNFHQFTPIMDIFDQKHIVTLLGIPISSGNAEYVMLSYVKAQRNFTGNRVLLTNENLVTLKFAYGQLIDAIRQVAANNMIRQMNEELEKVSVTDYLTGLYNRHGLSNIIEHKLSNLSGLSVLLMYIDLDNFKYYNDTFGHDIGDFVLVHFTGIFNNLVKDEGYTVRYGGDEFIMVLPGKTEADGRLIAEKIYEKIEDGCKWALENRLGHKIEIPAASKLSCSIGITEFNGNTREDIEQALTNADQALYFIKRNSKGHAMTWTKLQDFKTM